MTNNDNVNLVDQYSNSNSNNNTLNFSSNYNSISNNDRLEGLSKQNSKVNLNMDQSKMCEYVIQSNNSNKLNNKDNDIETRNITSNLKSDKMES